MEGHAMSCMELANKTADLRPQHMFKWLASRCDNVHSNPAGAQGCGHLQTNKARADDGYTFCGGRLGNNRLAVSEGAQIMNLRVRRAFDCQTNWIGAGC